MNVNITKKGRSVKLNKRERDTLTSAKTILVELGRCCAGRLASEAEECGEGIGAVQAMLAGTPEEVAAGEGPIA